MSFNKLLKLADYVANQVEQEIYKSASHKRSVEDVIQAVDPDMDAELEENADSDFNDAKSPYYKPRLRLETPENKFEDPLQEFSFDGPTHYEDRLSRVVPKEMTRKQRLIDVAPYERTPIHFEESDELYESYEDEDDE